MGTDRLLRGSELEKMSVYCRRRIGWAQKVLYPYIIGVDREVLCSARYVILYARANTRKHKKWEGDGFLTIHANGEMELSEESGREIARFGMISAFQTLRRDS